MALSIGNNLIRSKMETRGNENTCGLQFPVVPNTMKRYICEYGDRLSPKWTKDQIYQNKQSHEPRYPRMETERWTRQVKVDDRGLKHTAYSDYIYSIEIKILSSIHELLGFFKSLILFKLMYIFVLQPVVDGFTKNHHSAGSL